ncbi:sensor histidine kinase [Jannaschia sp. W003]|uniref:sensor histidine kinase n=1 Tax=Jannaschia sp. W003 TaxID=2867012 RepID=UPI0021A7D0CE|nr:sensor histidine kinase [Jannaschia sp. W003]UWQ23095.1 sensor histidine kinase [Jannaschia sp. W003]
MSVAVASLSLRARLTAIILGPLLVIAVGLGLWAGADAQRRAAERFDRSLLSTALAISRDVAATGGDALSRGTRDLLRDTSGGPVFYHAYAPDGVFVTGYATPPVPPMALNGTAPDRVFYDAIYRGSEVRALRLSETMTIDGLAGPFTFTVWQEVGVRDGFVASLTRRTSIVIATLIAALALLVWFGVDLGLRPLRDLEEAIARRSASDLGPIRRPIPPEVRGIVGTLNRLLGELSATFRAKDSFISNAAHQLRNPIAAVLSLAESLRSAPEGADLRERSADIAEAARALSRLADGLLALERAGAVTPDALVPVDVGRLLEGLAPSLRAAYAERGVRFTWDGAPMPAPIRADPLLLEQSVLNLAHNALAHGGPTLREVALRLEMGTETCTIEVADDGIGLRAVDIETARARFGQVRPGEGSGLGLPIAEAAAQAFGGTLELVPREPGLVVRMRLPLAKRGAGKGAPEGFASQLPCSPCAP